MSTYYLHDGRNEAGPFAMDILKKQKLTRHTPIRQNDSDSWLPAEKITELKELVAPQKIKRPKDIVPVMAARIADLHQRKPKILYGTSLCVALLAGLSFYSINSSATKKSPGNTVVEKQAAAPQAENNAGTTTINKTDPKAAKEKAEEDAAKAARLRWNKLISASNSNYGIGLLGGIKDLNVIVSNRTNYPIDQAMVKVTYIKANGEVWKTKLVPVYGIPAGESKEQSVPDVGRGKKVKVSLQKIVSKKMKFSYTEGQRGKNSGDPYLLQ